MSHEVDNLMYFRSKEALFTTTWKNHEVITLSEVIQTVKDNYFIISHAWRRQWHPTPVLLPGKSHIWRSLVGCSPWGRKESHTTEWLHFHFSLSCIGEGNGNPLQCSCLENPRDGGAWWVAIYGVAQSRTRLKWLSSSMHKKKPAFCCFFCMMTIICTSQGYCNDLKVTTLWECYTVFYKYYF